MTPRERVLKALRKEPLGTVPFTVYESLLPQCAVERELRNRGLCIVQRQVPVFTTARPEVSTTQETYQDGGRKFTRTVHETPCGTLSALSEHAGFTNWIHERLFKSPGDYPAILAYLKSEQYAPCYEEFSRAEEEAGSDVILRAAIGLEPLQRLISGEIMDMQTFCVEWMDHRDDILALYDAVAENARRIYPLVANSPATHANYGGNVTPEIISPAMFEEYYMPHYEEAAHALHQKGKHIGVHFDANCGRLAKLIGRTPLDYIEAFTPAPDTDMTLAEARAAWPDKVLWLNFPSSVHLRNDQEVTEFTVSMLKQIPSTDGLIMGITENMPLDRWRNSCRAIMDGLDLVAR